MVQSGQFRERNSRLIFSIKNLKWSFLVSILFSMLTLVSKAQNDSSSSISLGDVAPRLRLSAWIKGNPITGFEKGKVYIIEFWATWCVPCKAAMPRLSMLADKYKDRVTVVGIDIYEKKSTSIEKIKKFVDSMGLRMNYNVAVQDSNFMETDWILATGNKNQGIPRSFVVDEDGRLAWIGHPKDLEKILPKVINKTWDAKEEINKRNLAKLIEKLEDSVRDVLYKYKPNILKSGDIGKPDSALLVIEAIIKKEPRLTYAGAIIYNTFTSLLKINQQKALEYGRLIMVTPSYEGEPDFDVIVGAILNSDEIFLSEEIYQLGAEAYQGQIDHIVYPEIVDMYKRYHKMAAWYWLAKNKSKAIEAEQKAIIALKSKTEFSKSILGEYETALKKYRKANN